MNKSILILAFSTTFVVLSGCSKVVPCSHPEVLGFLAQVPASDFKEAIKVAKSLSPPEKSGLIEDQMWNSEEGQVIKSMKFDFSNIVTKEADSNSRSCSATVTISMQNAGQTRTRKKDITYTIEKDAGGILMVNSVW